MASIETVSMVTPEGETRHVNASDVDRFRSEHGWKVPGEPEPKTGPKPKPAVKIEESKAASFGEDHQD